MRGLCDRKMREGEEEFKIEILFGNTHYILHTNTSISALTGGFSDAFVKIQEMFFNCPQSAFSVYSQSVTQQNSCRIPFNYRSHGSDEWNTHALSETLS